MTYMIKQLNRYLINITNLTCNTSSTIIIVSCLYAIQHPRVKMPDIICVDVQDVLLVTTKNSY